MDYIFTNKSLKMPDRVWRAYTVKVEKHLKVERFWVCVVRTERNVRFSRAYSILLSDCIWRVEVQFIGKAVLPKIGEFSDVCAYTFSTTSND